MRSIETLTWHPDTFFTGLLRPDGVGIAYDNDQESGCVAKKSKLDRNFPKISFRTKLIASLQCNLAC